MKTSSQRLRSLILLSALALAMPSIAAAQSQARPVTKTITNNALTEDLALGTRKLTITTESTVEMQEGATVEGADIWRESLGAQAQSSILDDISALSATAYGLSVLEAIDSSGLKTLAGLANVTNDAQIKASDLDDDTTMAADSATRVPSQRAVKEALSLRASLDANTFTGVQSLPAGGATAPSIIFGDSTTGIYGSASAVRITSNNSNYWTFAEQSSVGVFTLNNTSRIAFASTNTQLGFRPSIGQTFLCGTGSGLAYTFAGDNATSGSTDARGGLLILEGGRGNGTGAGGDVVVATQPASGTSGSTLNASSVQMLARWSAKNVALTEGSATGVVRLAYSGTSNNASGGAVIHWTVAARQSNSYQALSGVSTINYAFGVTPTISTTANTAAVSTGTLTCTPTIVLLTSNQIELRLNATSSLSQDTLQGQASVISAHNLGPAGSITITPQ